MIFSRFVLDGQVYYNLEYSSHIICDDLRTVLTVSEDYTDPRITVLGCYLRFGDIPEGERSKNHRTEEMLEGVSVYRAAHLAKPRPGHPDRVVEDVVPILPNKAALDSYSGGMLGRRTYLVRGTEVGVGSDGEPLLRNISEERPFKVLRYKLQPA